METKFQTSFIPKKPVLPTAGASVPTQHHVGTSLFMTVAVFIFLASLAGVGGAYAWKSYLTSTQATYKQQLADRERQFNVDLIEELKRANIRIDMTTKLLAGHLALSQVFDVVARFTISNVQFTSLDVTRSATPNEIKIDMKGAGPTLAAVAFQSDVLGQLEEYGLRKVVKNPILTNPTVGSKGDVSFSLTATIDPSMITYSQAVRGEAASDPNGVPATTQVQQP